MTSPHEQHATAQAKRAGKRRRSGFGLIVTLLALVLAVAIAGMALTGRALRLPEWVVAEIESRLNSQLLAKHLPPQSFLALGGVSLVLGPNFDVRLQVNDLQVVEAAGTAVVALPEVELGLEGAALLSGQIRPSHLRLTGAQIKLMRDLDGRLALSIGGLSGAPMVQNPAELLDALDQMFSTETLRGLRLIEAQALVVTLDDARAARSWTLGDGRLVLENREDALAAELGVTLLGGARPAQARFTLETQKADSSARLNASFSQLDSGDLAAQAVPLAFLGLLEAPISGTLHAALDTKGAIADFSANLAIDAGVFRPASDADALGFEGVDLSLRYDQSRQRLHLDKISVQGPALRLSASGTGDLLDETGDRLDSGEWPAGGIVQLAFSEVMVDPAGLFEVPARFEGGAASLRLSVAPFRLEIGDLTLFDGEESLSLHGHLALGGGEVPQGPQPEEILDRPSRWDGALDVTLNQISRERLLAFWPMTAVPRTRTWVAENVLQGQIHKISASLRLAVGQLPRLALDFKFDEAEVRVVKGLPPVRAGSGRASIIDRVFVLVVEEGQIVPPVGGAIDVRGSVFHVPDITKKPAQAEVTLMTDGPLSATLSLLDEAPFHFITKAGRSIDLGQGRAVSTSDLRFPLIPKLPVAEVDYHVRGKVFDFRSEKLVANKLLKAQTLEVMVDRSGLGISGTADLQGMSLSGSFRQDFGPGDKPAKVQGQARINDARLRALGVVLPAGWLSGETLAEGEILLAKGAAPELSLRSDLKGAGLSIAELGWQKPAAQTGALALTASLGLAPQIHKLRLEAAGLLAEGSLRTKAGAGLEELALSRLAVGAWLDSPLSVIGRGAGRAPDIRLRGGRIDLAKRPAALSAGTGAGKSGIGTLFADLDRLQISDTLAIHGFSGQFTLKNGGLDGTFRGAVNGGGRISGVTVPQNGDSAYRITSNDAGRVMASAGIFSKGLGGSLDMTLLPTGAKGSYQGHATFADMSVQGAPALAALLSAASGIGLLEQLNGQGIHFSSGEAAFFILPQGIEVRQGSAVGASMGISFAGVYRNAGKFLDLRGTISPLYMLNGLGEIFGRRGEGLFGFNYQLSGPVAAPEVSVNPLSILTPGMFRDLFRRDPPRLQPQG